MFVRKMLLSFALYSFSATVVLADSKTSKNELPFPEYAHALETLTRTVAAFAKDDGRLIIVPAHNHIVLTTPFAPKGKSREQIFGKLSDGQRYEIVAADHDFDWRGVDVVDNKVLILDGLELALLALDHDTFKEVLRRTIPWDLIKPPRDRGGEPTAPETAELRARFKKQWRQTLGSRVTGMVKMPASWRQSPSRQYLLATRVVGFPLLLMECAEDDPSSCLIARQCNLEGTKGLLPSSISGLAVDEKSRSVIIGDAAQHRLMSFKFHTCYHVTKKDEFHLPAKLKQLSNLAIDAQGRLWLATQEPDDYHNASLYFWESRVW